MPLRMKLAAGRQAVRRSRSTRLEVEASRVVAPSRGRHRHRGGRHEVVGASGRHDHQVQLRRIEPRHGERVAAGVDGQAGGRLVVARDAPFADAGARTRIHSSDVSTSSRQVALVMTRAGAYIPHPVITACGATSHRGQSVDLEQRLLALHQCSPVDQDRELTVPATSDLISLNSFIASISPTTWPADTSPSELDVRARTRRRGAVPDPGQRGGDEAMAGRRLAERAGGRRCTRGSGSGGERAVRGRVASRTMSRRPRPPARPGRSPRTARRQRVDRGQDGDRCLIGRRRPYRRKTSVALCPPKPKALLIAVSMGTDARDVGDVVEVALGVGRCRRLMVGGIVPVSSAGRRRWPRSRRRRPRRWPVMHLVLLIGTV